MPLVLIGLGSNQNRQQNMQFAFDYFQSTYAEVQISDIIETEALNGQSANYLNALVAFVTEKDPFELRYQLKVLELKCGRDKTAQGIVALDADILLYGQQHIDHPLLKVPSDDFQKFPHINKLLEQINL